MNRWIVEEADSNSPPESLLPQGDTFAFIGSAVAGKWRCVGCRNSATGHYHMGVWNHVGRQQFATLDTHAWGTEVDPMIQMAAPKDGTTVWIYVLLGTTLLAWKPEDKDFDSHEPIKPLSSNDIWATIGEEPSRITTFNVNWSDQNVPTILLGTVSGLILWVKQKRIPHSLSAHKVTVKGSLSRMLTSVISYRPSVEHVVSICVAADKRFVSFSETGKRLDQWEWTDSPAGPTFTLENQLSLYEIIKTHFEGSATPFFKMEVYDAQLRNDDIFVLALVEARHAGHMLYWIHLQGLQLQSLTPFDHFGDPKSVLMLDHFVSSNGIPYAILAADASTPPVICALQAPPHCISYFSLDRHHDSSPLARSCFQDAATHGILFIDSSFKVQRARLLAADKEVAPQSVTCSEDLQLRLYEIYDEWFQFQNNQNMIFAPENRTLGQQEACIVACAKKIQREDSRDVMGRHLSFIEFLQNEGLYKNLSLYGKWSLMAIGQEICAYKAIMENPSPRLGQVRDSFRPYQLAAELSRMQSMVIDNNNNVPDDIMSSWLHYLKIAMGAAMTFRENHCSRSMKAKPSYDILPNVLPVANDIPSVPVWTSQVQHLLLAQIQHWKSTASAKPSKKDLEDILQYTLQALSDSYQSVPESKPEYAQAQKVVFELAHATGNCDQWLFQLCLAHNYFHGLCEIAGKYTPGTFDLVSLSGTLGQDLESGESFEAYVIQWFAARNRMGLAAKYGMAFPSVFSRLMDENVRGLEQFRWMLAVRSRSFDSAADSLLRNAGDPTKSLAQTKTALSLAKLSNHIAGSSGNAPQVKQRSLLIDKKRELLGLQELFVQSRRALTSKELLNKCLIRIDRTASESDEETLDLFFNSLAVCSTFPSHDEVSDGALLVWFKAIVKERDVWLDWLEQENDLSDSGLLARVKAKTLFGKLVEKSLEIEEWEDIHFKAVYAYAKSKWGFVEELDREVFTSKSMVRLLELLSSAESVAMTTGMEVDL